MKKIMTLAIATFAISVMASCMEKPVTFEQLPAQAKTYINTNFAGDKVVLATMDDDLIRPDYEVRLTSGTELQFDHGGALEKVSCRSGISADLIPQGIRDYVAAHFPSAGFREYEVGRRSYEVTLSNGMELKFNSAFNLMEIDD
jgi:hypothetical protein